MSSAKYTRLFAKTETYFASRSYNLCDRMVNATEDNYFTLRVITLQCERQLVFPNIGC